MAKLKLNIGKQIQVASRMHECALSNLKMFCAQSIPLCSEQEIIIKNHLSRISTLGLREVLDLRIETIIVIQNTFTFFSSLVFNHAFQAFS